mgnify:CR=1 FL=1
MRRLLLGIIAVLCVAVISLLVTLSGHLVAAGNGDTIAASIFWSVAIGCLTVSAICLSLLVVTLGVYVVLQHDDEAGSSS